MTRYNYNVTFCLSEESGTHIYGVPVPPLSPFLLPSPPPPSPSPQLTSPQQCACNVPAMRVYGLFLDVLSEEARVHVYWAPVLVPHDSSGGLSPCSAGDRGVTIRDLGGLTLRQGGGDEGRPFWKYEKYCES